MKKEKTVSKVPKKTTKKTTKKATKKVESKKKKGFTLIELLAVIIILGILMIIAIPSVTSYISNSRKNAYVETAKGIISGARNLVNAGKLGMYDTNTTYYIPARLIKSEGGEAESPYGKLEEAYVGVTYDGKGYSYYWTSRDDTGQGFKGVFSYDSLNEDQVASDIENEYVEELVKKNSIGCRTDIKILKDDGSWSDYLSSDYYITDDIFTESYMCPDCVYTRPVGSVKEGYPLNKPTVNDYRLLENYDTLPFFGITMNGNNVYKIYVCLVAGEKLLCIHDVYTDDTFDCQEKVIAKAFDIEEFSTESYEEFMSKSEACRKQWHTYIEDNISVPGLYCKSDKAGFRVSYSKGWGINFIASNGYLCDLQVHWTDPTSKEWGICEQH